MYITDGLDAHLSAPRTIEDYQRLITIENEKLKDRRKLNRRNLSLYALIGSEQFSKINKELEMNIQTYQEKIRELELTSKD